MFTLNPVNVLHTNLVPFLSFCHIVRTIIRSVYLFDEGEREKNCPVAKIKFQLLVLSFRVKERDVQMQRISFNLKRNWYLSVIKPHSILDSSFSPIFLYSLCEV
jgi:hypothetical protein